MYDAPPKNKQTTGADFGVLDRRVRIRPVAFYPGSSAGLIRAPWWPITTDATEAP
jgi:hypothetical protein